MQRIWLTLIQSAHQFNLDYDDAYQYPVASKHNLIIVSLDKHFDTADRGRRTQEDLLKWTNAEASALWQMRESTGRCCGRAKRAWKGSIDPMSTSAAVRRNSSILEMMLRHRICASKGNEELGGRQKSLGVRRGNKRDYRLLPTIYTSIVVFKDFVFGKGSLEKHISERFSPEKS